jgi:hypothetical protein
MRYLLIFVMFASTTTLAAVTTDDLIDHRLGAIELVSRSSTVLNHFKKIHPCPSTGLKTGTCPGWNIDHVIPRHCGGRDSVSNLQWLPESIKRTSDSDNKDRWERKVYCYPRPVDVIILK